MGKIRRIFPAGNTSQGFLSLHSNIISDDRNKLYIFKGMPGGGKSSMMKDIAQKMINKGYSIEYHHCPSDPDSVDAIVIEELKICLLDGTPPHSMDPAYPGMTDKVVDLAQFIDETKMEGKKEIISKAKANNKISYQKAFSYFKAARIIYYQIADDNRRMLDMKGINGESRDLIEKVFSKKEIPVDSNGFKERYLFSTAYTPSGFMDYTKTILEWVPDLYYINGDIGTGKDILLNRMLEEAKIRDFTVEVYLNSFIPDMIESLYIKELDTIITADKNGESLAQSKIDLNKYFDNSNTNKEDYDLFESLVNKGIKSLGGAKENHFILEKSYGSAINYKEIDRIREEIYKEILSYIE